MAWLFWPIFTALLAAGQGFLLPALRLTPPGAEAKRQGFALHGLFLVGWAWPLWLLPSSWAVAIVSRALLFDPLINITSGKPIFYVGKSAATDRAMQAVAVRLGWPADRVRAVAWVLAAAGAGAYFVLAA